MDLVQSGDRRSRVRILIVNQYFRPDQAASAQRLTDLAEDLAREHEVTVIAARPSYSVSGSDEAPRTPLRGLTVRRVPATAFARVRTWQRLLNYLTYLVSASLAGVFLPRVDLLVAATDPPLLSVVGLWLGRIHRAPFVHLMWDVQPDMSVAAGLIPRGWLARALSRLNRLAVTRATAVVVPTAAMGRTAVALGVAPERVQVVPHWEDLTVVAPGPKRGSFSRVHNLDGCFVVMYAGNHGLTQDLDRYLEVADRMRDLADVRFVFIGDGAAKPALVARAAALGLSNVTLLPYEPRAVMADAFAAADVCLAPLAAGLTPFMLPSKVYTILASGRPVLAAMDRSSDVAEMLEHHGCGVVVDPGDMGAVERQLRWWHAHRDEATAMGARGRRLSETRFSRAVVTPRFAELVNRVDAPREPSPRGAP